ncbi:MAG: DNA mismatch repair endonuclease MutL [Lachnospiraceae bacterium]|nr:DNA mismatch repair endonuclease MutL [Lachnospiraceae bacterium]
MPIRVLSQNTIDQIAAGEVVERPASVVKELVENALDAGATKISVETKNGGIDLIRVTDNGSGIERDEIPTAFLPHATSKIREITDLDHLSSLGFRGEALPSIASVSEVEVMTRTKDESSGSLFSIKGGRPGQIEEIGVPEGTTFLVHRLFYNTPARRNFLKTPVTEASYVGDLLEKIAFSHPEIAFKWTSEGKVRLNTPGNGNLKALVYAVFGRETAEELVEVSADTGYLKVHGVLGKPVLAKGNRNFELYFVNGRTVKNPIIEKAIEDAYQPFMMQHRYPFLVVYLELNPEEFDVNVHPSKKEIRFRREGQVYDELFRIVKEGLSHKEFIPEDREEKDESKEQVFEAPEPFEKSVSPEYKPEERPSYVKETPVLRPFRPEKPKEDNENSVFRQRSEIEKDLNTPITAEELFAGRKQAPKEEAPAPKKEAAPVQESFLSKIRTNDYRIVGQVFETYWIIETEREMILMDQHAAHEKILYEEKMRALREKKPVQQYVSPPVVVTLTERESAVLQDNLEWFSTFGYEIRHFGGREFAISAVPSDLYGLDVRSFFTEVIGSLTEHPERRRDPELLLQKIATMSCKAAVKGNMKLSFEEALALLQKLLTLDNPYACPHGRPTLIRMSKEELEKKFKRIVNG